MSRPEEVTGSIWVLLASGPSQCGEDIEAVRVFREQTGARVTAINNQIFSAPWADVHYVADQTWHEAYRKRPEAAPVLDEYRGERLGWTAGSARYGYRPVRRETGRGLGLTGVRSGANSGHQALNLAYLRGARLVILLGYDMQHTGGRLHNHPDHPAPLPNFSNGMPALCVAGFNASAPMLRALGCRVINASRESALRCFERLGLAEALKIAQQYAADTPPAAVRAF